jgi:transcriptional regulator with XRE-family HTH domain
MKQKRVLGEPLVLTGEEVAKLVALNLLRRRKELHLTRDVVAAEAAIAPQTLYLYEVGKREPRIADLHNLATILRTSVAGLLGEEQNETGKATVTHPDSDHVNLDLIRKLIQEELTDSEYIATEVEDERGVFWRIIKKSDGTSAIYPMTPVRISTDTSESEQATTDEVSSQPKPQE